MFNGIRRPSIYALSSDRELELVSECSYADFATHCGL
jgi:hypothetical protein